MTRIRTDKGKPVIMETMTQGAACLPCAQPGINTRTIRVAQSYLNCRKNVLSRRPTLAMQIVAVIFLALFSLVVVAAPTQQSVNYTQIVSQADSKLTWLAPSSIPFGIAIGDSQLRATARVAGTFTYTPQAGTILPTGVQSLSVAFKPDDLNYRSETATIQVTVPSPSESSFKIAIATPLDALNRFFLPAEGVGTLHLVVSPIGNFDQPVKLACPPVPQLTCAFTPQTVNPTIGPVAVTLLIRYLPNSSIAIKSYKRPSENEQALQSSDPASGGSRLALMFMLPATIVLCGLKRRRNDGATLLLMLFTLSMLSLCVGCGSGKHGDTLTISGTSLVESRSVQLIVMYPR